MLNYIQINQEMHGSKLDYIVLYKFYLAAPEAF